MTTNDLCKLATLIQEERETLLTTWRTELRQLASAKRLDTPTLNDHIPGFLDELCVSLRSNSIPTIAEALDTRSPPAHGIQRLHDGFDIEEVIAEYNILRGCIHDLGERHGLTLQGKPFHVINGVLDRAIGSAVETYSTQKALEIQHRREEYLAFVAHDLRTPLNAISLATRVLEMLLPKQDVPVEMGQMLKSLRRNVLQLDALVNKVLEENTNLQTEVGVKLALRTLDLWPLVEALIHDLHPVAGTSSTRLINEVPEDLMVYADASLLRRIFQNLIANAIKYTPRGEIRISARELAENGEVECSISDNGAGISEDRLQLVFEKFETDDQHDGSLGLGLAIVKTFVEAHQGQVHVESQAGCGSTFRFTLPAKPK